MELQFDYYVEEISNVLENEVLKSALQRFTSTYWNSRKQVFRRLPYYEYYRKRVREVKAWSIEHLDTLIKMVKENIESLGGAFYLANTADDARRYVLDTCSYHGAKLIVKSKSMVSEEIDLNRFLIEKGFEVVETDLGEWIIQLRNEKPTHMVYPAIHLTREEIAKTFSKIIGREIEPETRILVRVAREVLRQKFISADVGVSGANAVAADTGTIVIIENEGNARFVTNAPPVHICLTGIEKMVPTVEDAIMVSRITVPNASGQLMPTYISLISGPSRTGDIELSTTLGVHGPREFHLVLIDNGRSKMINDPIFKEAAYCLRCGACLSECPVYREIGGIVWSYKYMGGIGAVWTAFTHGIDKAANIILTCATCGRCRVVCPLEIDIPRMILKLREILFKSNIMPRQTLEVVENIKSYGNPFGIPPSEKRL